VRGLRPGAIAAIDHHTGTVRPVSTVGAHGHPGLGRRGVTISPAAS